LKKIAIFVEGQTEKIFVEQFLQEYFGVHTIELEFQKRLGKTLTKVTGSRQNPFAEYTISIIDMAGDSNVFSALYERAEKMIQEGYLSLLAIRDVYPQYSRDQIDPVLQNFSNLFIQFSFRDRLYPIFAIMEIEAWFLADYNVFSRINPLLTPELVKERLNIDLIETNPQSYEHPAGVIDKIYRLFGETYQKHEKQAYQLVYKLDYDYLVCAEEVLNKVSSWKYCLDCVDKSVSDR
jgi:hypothetical protein